MRDLREIERGAAAATAGPWFVGGVNGPELDEVTVAKTAPYPLNRIVAQWSGALESEKDAIFIANARTDVPEMAAQILADDELLLRLEWEGRPFYADQYGDGGCDPIRCPVCRKGPRQGHASVYIWLCDPDTDPFEDDEDTDEPVGLHAVEPGDDEAPEPEPLPEGVSEAMEPAQA